MKTTHPTPTPASREDRKLDTLARLLEGKSECTAVCIYNGQILVSANELNDASRSRNEITDHIRRVYGYFKDLCKNGTSDDECGTIKAICTESIKIKSIAEALTAVRERDLNNLIDMVLFTSGRPPSLKSWDQIEKSINGIEESYLEKKFGRDGTPGASAVLAIVYDRAKDFHKLKDELSKDDIQLAPALRDMKSALRTGLTIARGAAEVHAELRIIDYVMGDQKEKQKLKEASKGTIKTTTGSKDSQPKEAKPTLELDKDIYIGISKLCCKNCYAAVAAINQSHKIKEERSPEEESALKQAESSKFSRDIKDTPIEELFRTRGSHRLSFLKKWTAPKFLAQVQTSYDTILASISAPEDKTCMKPPMSESSPAKSDITIPPISTEELLTKIPLDDLLKESRKKLEGIKDESDETKALLEAITKFASKHSEKRDLQQSVNVASTKPQDTPPSKKRQKRDGTPPINTAELDHSLTGSLTSSFTSPFSPGTLSPGGGKSKKKTVLGHK